MVAAPPAQSANAPQAIVRFVDNKDVSTTLKKNTITWEAALAGFGRRNLASEQKYATGKQETKKEAKEGGNLDKFSTYDEVWVYLNDLLSSVDKFAESGLRAGWYTPKRVGDSEEREFEVKLAAQCISFLDLDNVTAKEAKSLKQLIDQSAERCFKAKIGKWSYKTGSEVHFSLYLWLSDRAAASGQPVIAFDCFCNALGGIAVESNMKKPIYTDGFSVEASKEAIFFSKFKKLTDACKAQIGGNSKKLLKFYRQAASVATDIPNCFDAWKIAVDYATMAIALNPKDAYSYFVRGAAYNSMHVNLKYKYESYDESVKKLGKDAAEALINEIALYRVKCDADWAKFSELRTDIKEAHTKG